MQRTPPPRHWLTSTVTTAVLLVGAAAVPPATAATRTGGPSQRPPLFSVAEVSARRIATGDLVAAAKWGAGEPVDAPARELRVLDSAAGQARKLGADPRLTRRVLRDQIEANKKVQRALHRLWRDHPGEAPTDRPDLDEAREEIDRLNEALVRAVADAAPYRRSVTLCRTALAVSAGRVGRDRSLDELHAAALDVALRSVCAAANGVPRDGRA
ncbi:gamma subclass chorismate mutase AroQ [Streptomyces sp. JV184]|uniref:gamma subclass chorismate mutase AroQ n=1 Tax=Streptomyces sp. JV184 TaxID=858637 RepID=UPI002E77402C|nr:gamma subclass chorismate mutase AroQ [Streptomyces sp. JV184]MEE1746216.1 gamma subclass chorismate mutase AroQ [Streptomyces sp. JV184]